MEEEKYKKSFNKVINDALYFGLDELMRYLFESEETIKEQEQYRKQKLIRKLDGVNEVYFMEIAKLLKDERQFSGNDTNSFINRVYYTARKLLFIII